jgi:hypothetical protein
MKTTIILLQFEPEKGEWILPSLLSKSDFKKRLSDKHPNKTAVPKGIKPMPGFLGVPNPREIDSKQIKNEKKNQKRLLPIS